MKLNDAIFGFILMLLGGIVLLAVQGYPKIPGQPVGPALFPGLIAAGLCICGVLLAARGVRQRMQQRWVTWDDWLGSPRHMLGFVVLVGVNVFYILVSDRLGFLITAAIVLASLFLVLRVRLPIAIGVAIVASLADALRVLQAAAGAAALGRAAGVRMVTGVRHRPGVRHGLRSEQHRR